MADSFEPQIPVTSLEQRMERIRARVGLVLAPLIGCSLYFSPIAALADKPEAHKLAAVLAAVVTLWITEALPLPVTALLGAAACTLLRVADAKTIFSPFADQLMFLFIGSFILARAIFLHGLDRRLAFGVMSLAWVGGRPARILLAYGAVTAFISAWISNTATTAMMMAIGLSMIQFLYDPRQTGAVNVDRRYATGIMLMTSFSASIGGLATPIGTPPNVIGLSFIRKFLDVEIPFFEWMLLGVPVVVLLYACLFLYLNWFCPSGVRELAGSRELLLQQRHNLGPWTRGQISTVIAFATTIVLWVAPGVVALTAGENSPMYRAFRESCPEGVAALIGAALLFLLPGHAERRAITWDEAVEIDWGVVLLYGGGFSLGELSRLTGLADALGNGLAATIPLSSDLALLSAATIVAVLVSEATSNTAAANIVVPLAISLAQAAGCDPLAPALGATFGASLGFMLPVSTPCNAIVYGTGHVPLGRMIRYGLLLDVLGIIVTVTLVHWLTPVLQSRQLAP